MPLLALLGVLVNVLSVSGCLAVEGIEQELIIGIMLEFPHILDEGRIIECVLLGNERYHSRYFLLKEKFFRTR